MSNKTIFTLNARGNVFLDVLKEHFKLDDKIMYSAINGMFAELISILDTKKIKYEDLKSCLTPKIDRKELALVFDTTKVQSNWYGYEVFKEILSNFDKNSSHTVLCGDYIGNGSFQKDLYINFQRELIRKKDFDYQHSTQFYIVYINNLSSFQFENLIQSLENFSPFIGYFDTTNQSFIKSYLSSILVVTFIKYKNSIILEHEDDRNNEQNINLIGYNFEDYNYKIFSLQGVYFGVFLSYKIERAIYSGFESDLSFSLNSMSSIISKISKIEIEDSKLNYLKTVKAGKLKKANLINYPKEKIIKLISQKIDSNYIYNLTDIKEHNVLKFDIIIELKNILEEVIKITIAFEYIPNQEKIRLITLY
ncbi:MAG: hypothetical protein E2590_10710 [Chryseobacterium sp.]|nr:hypothetical protein [Chryseobacterium sp.]